MTAVGTVPMKKDERPTREALAERLLRLRDEMIVRNHLAGMEVKDAVHELGHEIEKVAQTVAHGVEDAATTLPHEAKLRMYLALLDSNARFLEMESAVKTALAGAARSATVVAETARLKAALGRMDAEAAFEERREHLKQEMHDVEVRSARVLEDIGARVTKLGIETSKII